MTPPLPNAELVRELEAIASDFEVPAQYPMDSEAMLKIAATCRTAIARIVAADRLLSGAPLEPDDMHPLFATVYNRRLESWRSGELDSSA